MILQLSEECPIFQSASEPYLQRLLYTITMQRWHLIAMPSPDRLESILPDHLWRTYRDLLLQTYKQATTSAMTIAINPNCNACDPEKLVRFFTMPVVVIVEDVHSDGAWIRLVASNLRPRLARQTTGDSPCLEFHHAGGITQIPAEIERIAKLYQSSRQAAHWPLRVVAVSDSDAKLPGTISQQATAVRAAAIKTGADFHILNKRTIENYVPDETLMDYASVRRSSLPAAEYITSFGKVARDHYPMKKGLTSEEVSQVGGLYGKAPRIEIGMGDFIKDLLENFYHLTKRHQLKQRDHTGELEALLDILERNI